MLLKLYSRDWTDRGHNPHKRLISLIFFVGLCAPSQIYALKCFIQSMTCPIK